MKVYDVLPPASIRAGFYRAAAPWKDVAVVEFGPEGTMHYVQSNVRGETGHFFATGLKEKQIIFGDTENLEQAILEVDRRLKPGWMIVMSSPVSEIIGADLRAVCCKTQRQVQAVLSVWDQLPVEADEFRGKRKAYEMAASYLKKIASNLPESQPEGVLVLGLSEVDYNGVSDLNEIRRMMQDYLGMPLLNDELGRYALRDVKRARWILTVEPEAEPLAAAAQELWGIPRYQGVPYGLNGCKELMAAAEQATGLRPNDRWEQDLKEAAYVIRQFHTGMENRRPRGVFLDIRPSRMAAMEIFLTKELELKVTHPHQTVSAVSTDGAVTRELAIAPDDILLASGLLCSLYRSNDSICLEDPVVRQRTFSRHLPLMGLWGAENFLTLFYPLLL